MLRSYGRLAIECFLFCGIGNRDIVGELKRLLPTKVDGTHNLADLGTKVFLPHVFHRLREPLIHA